MALIKQKLIDGLDSLLKNPPLTKSDAANRWASMLGSYLTDVQAGPVKPSAPINSLPIKSAIESSAFGDFAQKIDIGFDTCLRSIVWIGPGFTGTTLNALGFSSALVSSSSALLSVGSNTDEAISILANAIHTFVKTVTVTIINVTTGAPAIVTLI